MAWEKTEGGWYVDRESNQWKSPNDPPPADQISQPGSLAAIQREAAKTGVYNNFEGGKNNWSILNGKLYLWADDAQSKVPGEVLGAYGDKIASPHEKSRAINEDDPLNGAGKGSMKEGILSAIGAAASMYGAGNFLSGMGIGTPVPGMDYSAVGGTGGLNDLMGSGFNPGSEMGYTGFGEAGTSYGAGGGFSSTPVEIQPGFDPSNIAGQATFSESLGSALRNPLGFGSPGTGALSQLTGAAGSSLGGIAGTAGSALGGAASGAYQFPWGNVIGSVLGAVGANSSSKDLADAMRYATDKADPFAQERPFYQGQLKSMYTDPNYFSNSPVMKGLVDTSLDQTQRKLASQGYNYSGNTQSELAKLATNESFKYAQNQQDMTAKAAGAYNGPGAAGTVAATGAAAQLGLNNQLYGNLGAGFQSIINGSQPTLAQQVNGAQPRRNLADAVYTGPAEDNQTNRNWSF